MNLPDGKGWLMRPVMNGMCQFESLRSGLFDLVDIADMNDALDVRDENARRADAARKST